MLELDFAGFGGREINEVRYLLKLWQNEKYSETAWEHFDKDRIPLVNFNPSSGLVFLRDDDYNCVIELSGKLHLWMTCSECSNEGADIVYEPVPDCDGCQEIAKTIK